MEALLLGVVTELDDLKTKLEIIISMSLYSTYLCVYLFILNQWELVYT